MRLEKKMNEYDRRQYNLMKKCLHGFEIGNVDIRVLINSLRSLTNALQNPNGEWKRKFMHEWWTLEEIYSIASSREQSYLSKADSNDIYEAIDKMKQLLNELTQQVSQIKE